MQRLIQVMLLFLLFSLSACQLMAPEPLQLPEGAQLGEKFYTQVTMQYEKAKYRTTNYRRGTLLAVNSAVSNSASLDCAIASCVAIFTVFKSV